MEELIELKKLEQLKLKLQKYLKLYKKKQNRLTKNIVKSLSI